jgi:protein-disulfide isomerase
MKTGHELSETRIDPDRDHIQGDADAAIQLLEYGDYECPYCAEAHVAVKEVLRKLGRRKICFAYRHFPLAKKHPNAEPAAEAAESAGTRNKFWEMHDLLFENQDALGEEDFVQYAEEIGLNGEDVIGDVGGGTNFERIQEDYKAGERAGVDGTPTFFLNGERLEGDLDADSLLEKLKATQQKQSP